jgi:hypothetical protein
MLTLVGGRDEEVLFVVFEQHNLHITHRLERERESNMFDCHQRIKDVLDSYYDVVITYSQWQIKNVGQ